MRRLSLNGDWSFRVLDSAEWLPAQVPGGVHTDLLALGKIPDPFIADNEKQVGWVAESDWEYTRTFSAPADVLACDRQHLICDGLDTLAEVFLNGQLLGKADNMFRQWAWEVKEILHAGQNELRVIFRAPVAYIRACQQEQSLTGGGDIPGGPHLRKAPSQWGWDWGPKLPPIGIWKDICLEGYSTARFLDVHIRQHHQPGQQPVRISAAARVEDWAGRPLTLTGLLTSPAGALQIDRAEITDGQAAIEIEVTEPQLWWPNGYGQQPLYQLEVTLSNGETTHDRRAYSIGLRTVELHREPDDWGESFQFHVNGVPLFAKGANWIPADSFPTRITDAHLEHLVASAAAANMNMLRVWGGGFYEDERFYDLCDRYGILVWQDFIFACGIYPADADFAENMRQEAVETVRRLRHRACLALWCGNNEMEQGWVDWGWNQPNDSANQRLKAGYDRMFHHLLPAVVAAEDPDRAYWPSSASSGVPFAEPNGALRGDMHYWEVWHHRKPFTAYRDQFPRFMSEFGFQALPPYRTVQAFAAPEDQNMTSYIMEHHQRSRAGNGLIIAQMTETYRMPKDFPALVYLSMLLQAEGIRYGVEHWRRQRHRVGGTLYWQLNDCWPVVSWSSLDSFGRWKALHYAARRFYAPLLLSIEDSLDFQREGARLAVHLTSDLVQPWSGEVRWRLETMAGQALASDQQAVNAAPLANRQICALDFNHLVNENNRREVIFVAELWQDGQRLSYSVSTFAPPKHLALEDPSLRVDMTLEGSTLRLAVSACSLAKGVQLALEGVDAVFSDNYFDLPAGQTAEVTTLLPAGWSLEQAQAALRVSSLMDSYR